MFSTSVLPALSSRYPGGGGGWCSNVLLEGMRRSTVCTFVVKIFDRAFFSDKNNRNMEHTNQMSQQRTGNITKPFISTYQPIVSLCFDHVTETKLLRLISIEIRLRKLRSSFCNESILFRVSLHAFGSALIRDRSALDPVSSRMLANVQALRFS